MESEIDRLRRENQELKKAAAPGVTYKVAAKGGMSVYGLGRYPTTLYKEQWLVLLDHADEIRAFIKANDKSLKAKGD
jgi:hypothetical protein